MLSYPNLTLHEIIRVNAERYPDRTVVWFGDKSLTYSEFDLQSNRLANALTALGMRSGDRLAIFLYNCPQYELALYAASKIGAISCPLSAAYRESELLHVLHDTEAKVLITDVRLWPFIQLLLPYLRFIHEIVLVGEHPDIPHVHSWSQLIADQATDPPGIQVSSDQLALLLYSSGTTGKPKGVMLTHSNLVACQAQVAAAGSIQCDDVFLLYMPLGHVYGLSAIMGVAIYAGAQHVLMERFDLDAVVRVIEKKGVTWLHVVPPVLRALATAPDLRPEQFRTIKFVMNAAAPLPPDVARRVEERLHVRVIQAYGMTEASPCTHHSPIEPHRIKLESVGVPCGATQQRVVDLETGERDLGPGEIGELLVRGPQIMQGYWRAEEETGRVLRDGWLHTGDIGWIDTEGYAFIADRKKEMIKFNAFSIAPAELEGVLLDHPDVADCGVVGIRNQESGEAPVAFVVPREGCTIDFEVLSQFMAERVAGYKRIQQWEVIDKIPRTPTGKILRRELKQLVPPPDDTTNS